MCAYVSIYFVLCLIILYYTSVLLFEIYFTVFSRKNWKKIKIQIALDFIFCHHLEPEFTATTRNFASSISRQKHLLVCIYLPRGPASC